MMNHLNTLRSKAPGYVLLCVASLVPACAQTSVKPTAANTKQTDNAIRSGEGAFGDWTTDAPGVRRKITVADLPKPYESTSANNGPKLVARPEGLLPSVPAGFKVELVQTGLKNPRLLRAAPNGDLFIAESAPGQIHVLRLQPGTGKVIADEVFIGGQTKPFGIAFYPAGPNPQFVYIGNTDKVVRVPYRNGDLKARAVAEVIVSDIPGGGLLRGGGHWTRDLAFSKDGKKLYVSVGSMSNVHENASIDEKNRADILEYNPDGTGFRIFASGIRNAVGIAVEPRTGALWASVNERDGLGDNLVPDYITRVKDSGFYGWPWFYLGPNQDPRHAGAHPELKDQVIVPDVLLQPHSASLEMCFYTGKMFPGSFSGDVFAAEHGSWNRARRTGYKIIRVPLKKGVPTGEYEDFMTGFVTPAGDVWGRPVGVTVGSDGSLFVTDDGTNSVWRISYSAK